MAGPLDKVIHPKEQERILEAIRCAERLTSGELKVHIEGRCPVPDPAKRAQDLFSKLGLTRTRDRNGVLLYVATRERRFAILGDQGIGEDPSSPFWDEARQRMTFALRRGAFGEGIVNALMAIGERMSKKHPRNIDDKNEIDNEISTDEACR